MPRKKQRRKELTYAYYDVEITGWDWDLSFGVNIPKYEDRQYSDYRHLQIHGTLLRPRKLKVETVELTVLPNIDPAAMELRHDQPPPRAVGSVSVEGKKSEGTKLVGNLSMPTDALGPVLQMLLAGRFKCVLMDGEAMRWRKALIRNYRLTAEHDEADYPDDE
jgi:hypothetical protein